MIQYIYSMDRGPNNEKYYLLYGETSPQELKSIFEYTNLISVDFLTTFGITWTSDE